MKRLVSYQCELDSGKVTAVTNFEKLAFVGVCVCVWITSGGQ